MSCHTLTVSPDVHLRVQDVRHCRCCCCCCCRRRFTSIQDSMRHLVEHGGDGPLHVLPRTHGVACPVRAIRSRAQERRPAGTPSRELPAQQGGCVWPAYAEPLLPQASGQGLLVIHCRRLYKAWQCLVLLAGSALCWRDTPGEDEGVLVVQPVQPPIPDLGKVQSPRLCSYAWLHSLGDCSMQNCMNLASFGWLSA